MHSRLANMSLVSAEQVTANMSPPRSMEGKTCSILSGAWCVRFEGRLWALVYGVGLEAICGRPPVVAPCTGPRSEDYTVHGGTSFASALVEITGALGPVCVSHLLAFKEILFTSASCIIMTTHASHLSLQK